MRKIFFILFLSIISLSVYAQGPSKKCPTCGQSIAKCQYKGKHPAKNTGTTTPPKKQPTSEAAGYDVTFTCNVSSATLYIDGNANGNASGTRFLKTGRHSIKVTSAGYEDYTGSIEVNRQQTSFNISLIRKKSNDINIKGVTYKMIAVEGGTFTMGATSEMTDPWDDEKPTHQVTLSNYSIGETEVTQALWEAVMGTNPSSFKGANKPVENVSWNDCQSFISKLNSLTGQHFRLPTEAEWEFAARGGNKSRHTQYSGSNDINAVAWYTVNSYDKGSSSPDFGTHNVKTKLPNELGIYDMSGNVWEWCSDWYGNYSSSSQTNPKGPSSGSDRVGRGGSWDGGTGGGCRSSFRYSITPSYRSDYLGLRLVLSGFQPSY